MILSRTHSEFMSLLKGAQHRRIDEYEFASWKAVATAKAQSGKVTPKKLFNAKAARNRLEGGFAYEEHEIKRMLDMNKKVQGFNPKAHFKPKGGSR